jgi:hypothetical protein
LELSCLMRASFKIARQSRQPIGVVAHNFKKSPVIFGSSSAAQQVSAKPDSCEES